MPPKPHHTSRTAGSSPFASLWLFLGFGVCGAACVMPGAILPTFLLRWHLSDQRAGALLLICAVGSGIGALLSLPTFRATIVSASACIAAAAALWASPIPYPEPSGFLWGLGLGTLMTATSLLHQRAANGTSALIRLNFIWAAGAFICAPLMTHALRVTRPRSVLLCFAVLFAVYAVASLFILTGDQHRQAVPFRSRAFNLRGIPPSLILACALTVAVESACGGWLSTYATREHTGLFAIVAAPSCLWAGLLISRALSWLPQAHKLLASALNLQISLVVASSLAIILSHSALVLLLAAFLMGFGLGPLYPLMLDTVLRRRQTGSIFFLAGFAGSLLPWLTGLASTHTGTLRRGFVVVLAANITLALLIHHHRQEILQRLPA